MLGLLVAQPLLAVLLPVQTKLAVVAGKTKRHSQERLCHRNKPMSFYRRNLPHWHPEGKAIFITWRLFGSLPKGVAPERSHWARKSDTATPGCVPESTGRSACATESAGREFRRMDAELDKGATGPLWLRDPKIASLVEDTIFRGDELKQYQLDAYVVMPNHVHALLWPWIPMDRVTGGIKGVSARNANATLGRTGQHFWEDESFDHWVRSGRELERIRTYIERNPVTAGLVERPEDWPWSSAAKKSDTATPGCVRWRTGRSACATAADPMKSGKQETRWSMKITHGL